MTSLLPFQRHGGVMLAVPENSLLLTVQLVKRRAMDCRELATVNSAAGKRDGQWTAENSLTGNW